LQWGTLRKRGPPFGGLEVAEYQSFSRLAGPMKEKFKNFLLTDT
jgi:hypothetical protein